METKSHILKSLNRRTFGYAPLPHARATDRDPLVRNVHATIAALVTLDQHVGSDDQGSAHTGLLIATKRAREALRNEAAVLEQDRSAFYSPPASREAALDIELRDYVRSLSRQERATLMADVGQGKHPEILHALARFPAPTPDSQTARGLYRAQREKADPETARALQDREDAIDWAEATLAALTSVVDDATAKGVLPPAMLVMED
jgi:hypothetical protein